METFTLIMAGLVIGSIITFLIVKMWLCKNYIESTKYVELQKQVSEVTLSTASLLTKDEVNTMYVSKDMHDVIANQLNEAKKINIQSAETISNLQTKILTLATQSEQKLSRLEVDENFRPKESYELVNRKLANAEAELQNKEARILQLTTEFTELKQREEHVVEKLNKFQEEIQSLHTLSKEQFRNLASDLLEEKKKMFLETNKTEIKTILEPFTTNLNTFKEKIESTRKEDIQDLTSLKKEIDLLQKLNTQLSDDAKQLTMALKSDVKMQGNWGEDRLNLILETEGLLKYVDFTREESFRDEEQERNRKPDFILRLPNGKHIVIDSKVSLTAYVAYFNSTSPVEKADLLQQHMRSVMDHIDKLSSKNYQSLAGLTTPDYVFLFMPVESALTLALNNNQEIFNIAIKKKIVLVTPSTLIAALKIVKIIWQKESQVKNVEEIFKQAGALYDKFVGFLDHMDRIESGLSLATKAHGDAMHGLKTGARKGHTIIGRFESLKELEAKVTKQIPEKYLSEVNLLDNSEFGISEGLTLLSGEVTSIEKNG